MSNINKLLETLLDQTLAKSERKAATKERRKFLENSVVSITNFTETLAKNDCEITNFDNGEFKMEFGPEVPETVKKRAMDWAKKKGFKPVEMSLGKNADSSTWTIFRK